MKEAEVTAEEDVVRELCKTDLPTASICRYLERDGNLLGYAGTQQARPLMRRTWPLVAVCALALVEKFT